MDLNPGSAEPKGRARYHKANSVSIKNKCLWHLYPQWSSGHRGQEYVHNTVHWCPSYYEWHGRTVGKSVHAERQRERQLQCFLQTDILESIMGRGKRSSWRLDSDFKKISRSGSYMYIIIIIIVIIVASYNRSNLLFSDAHVADLVPLIVAIHQPRSLPHSEDQFPTPLLLWIYNFYFAVIFRRNVPLMFQGLSLDCSTFFVAP